MAHSALVLCALSASAAPSRPGRGNVGVWVYDHPSAEPPAQWAGVISEFNAEAQGTGRLDHVVLYGSDVEIYESGYCCTPPSSVQMGRRLREYGSDAATTVTLVVDGRMDGRQSWAPDLSRLSAAEITGWATWISGWVCAYDRVDGLQLDLEPIAGPWNANLRLLFRELSTRLASRDYGCVSPRRPKGIALSTFALARDVDVNLFDALGDQGYVVVSGYDLGSGSAGTPHSPASYEKALRTQLESIRRIAAAAGGKSYMVGVPAAASTFEFESYLLNGALVESGYSQVDYLAAALRSTLAVVATDSNFLGLMLWTLSYTNVYPPHSANEMNPTSAYASAVVWEYLKNNLPGNSSTGFKLTPPVPEPAAPPPQFESQPAPPPSSSHLDPPPPPSHDKSYGTNGCTDSTNCTVIIGFASYCKSNTDGCGRRVCHGDAHVNLAPCA